MTHTASGFDRCSKGLKIRLAPLWHPIFEAAVLLANSRRMAAIGLNGGQ